MVSKTHNIFFSKSSEKYKKFNKKFGIQDNKSNDSFSTKNNLYENQFFNPFDNKQKYIIKKKKTTNKKTKPKKKKISKKKKIKYKE